MTTVSAALIDPLMKRDPVGPRITYYDDATGERIEVSTVTLANWAAKTANLLRDELGAGPGSRVAVLLPAHWQTAAVLLGIWWIGAEVIAGRDGSGAEVHAGRDGSGAEVHAGRDGSGAEVHAGRDGSGAADIAMCTADRLDEADAAAGMGEIVALSLDAFGKAVPDLPIGITDYAGAVRVHGDQIQPERNPGPALNGRSAAEVIAAALASAEAQGLTTTDRVLSTARWGTDNDDTDDELIRHLLAVFAAGASLVQVAHADPAVMDRRRQMEKVTRG